jgi:uncharacterized membrane protein
MKKVMFVITAIAFMTMTTSKVSAQTQTGMVKGYILSDIQAMSNANCQHYACTDRRGNTMNTCGIHCMITTGESAGQTIWCQMNAGMVAHGTYQKGDNVFIVRASYQMAETKEGIPVHATITSGDGTNYFQK